MSALEAARDAAGGLVAVARTGVVRPARPDRLVRAAARARGVTHVRFGQVWSKALTENDPERREKVLNFQRKVDRAFSLGGLRGSYDGANVEQFLPLAVELRKLAGFSDEEIADVAGAGPKVKR